VTARQKEQASPAWTASFARIVLSSRERKSYDFLPGHGVADHREGFLTDLPARNDINGFSKYRAST